MVCVVGSSLQPTVSVVTFELDAVAKNISTTFTIPTPVEPLDPDIHTGAVSESALPSL